MTVTSLPAGWLSDRFGAKSVTLAATALMLVSAVAQAMPSYLALLSGRFVFGIAFGMVWTAALAWLAGISTDHGRDDAGSLGVTVTVGAIGTAIGPAASGALAEQIGIAAPFVVAAVVAAVLLTVLSARPGPARGPHAAAPVSQEPLAPPQAVVPSVTDRTQTAQGSGPVWAAATALAVSGAAGAVVSLLAPIQLDRAGFTASSIGLVLSSASVAYILSSSLTVRYRTTITRLQPVALLSLGVAVSVAPGTVSASAIAVAVVVTLSAIPRAAIGTVGYSLATRTTGAAKSGTTIGLLNTIWASSQALAPLGAGALSQSFSTRMAYLALVAGCALAAGAQLLQARALQARALQAERVTNMATSA